MPNLKTPCLDCPKRPGLWFKTKINCADCDFLGFCLSKKEHKCDFDLYQGFQDEINLYNAVKAQSEWYNQIYRGARIRAGIRSGLSRIAGIILQAIRACNPIPRQKRKNPYYDRVSLAIDIFGMVTTLVLIGLFAFEIWFLNK